MSSDYKDKFTSQSPGLFRSFQNAITGIITAILTERNMKIHFSVAAFVIFASFLFNLTAGEWLLVLFAIGGVIALELINSAIERAVDLTTDEYHLLAKQAKDMAAGAVLVYAILSVIVGLVIFLPKIVALLEG